VDLALAQCHAGDAAGAAKTLRRVLLFSPDDEGARRLSLALDGGRASCGAAK
jgi:hypothetical protein